MPRPPIRLTLACVDVIPVINMTEVVLIKRSIPPYMNRLCLIGGHFDADNSDNPNPQFRFPPDANLKSAGVRETLEEGKLPLSEHELTFLCHLDGIGRDVRETALGDDRRVSACFWAAVDAEDVAHHCHLDPNETDPHKNEVEEIVVVRLDSITEEMMGFDHYEAIKLLQQMRKERVKFWSGAETLQPYHECNQILRANNRVDIGYHIRWKEGQPHLVTITKPRQENPPSSVIKTCPFCGKTIHPPLLG